ncbi:MAG TPA: IS256 family transposase [Hyphomicrobiaceae bacterium]|jgi:putative transposase|nr:IS256 family transposase [Hyphomicrobiaceae bacterium]
MATRVSATDQTRERLEALIDGRLASAPERSDLMLLAARLILEEALEGEVRDRLGRERYERTEGPPTGYRNGYRTGRMKTAEGMVEYAAPQVRATSEPFVSAVRENLAGRTGALEDLAIELYARGLSTRDIEDTFTDEKGRRLLSRAAVSEITERLWEDYAAFTKRALAEHRVVYLYIDGIAERLRAGQPREAVLAAWGIGEDGRKVLLHLMAGSKEDTETVRAFFQDMRARGLGDPLLVVSDGAPGIIRAIEECFPRSARQRCLAHRMRNLAVKVPTDLWPEFKARVTACYQAPSRAIARNLAEGIRADYATTVPSAVACFEDDFEACIAHLRLPVTHRQATRTTNLLERLFVEERRRLKIIPNGFGEKAVLKLMFAALIRAADRWRGLRFSEFELRQIAAVRKDLDTEYEATITPSGSPSESRFSSKSSP